jgi:hypothetical protein
MVSRAGIVSPNCVLLSLRRPHPVDFQRYAPIKDRQRLGITDTAMRAASHQGRLDALGGMSGAKRLIQAGYKMNSGLHEVISAAVRSAWRSEEADGPGRPVPLLRAVETDHAAASRVAAAITTSAVSGFVPASGRRRRAPLVATDNEIYDDVGTDNTPQDLIGTGARVARFGGSTIAGAGATSGLMADTIAADVERAGSATRSTGGAQQTRSVLPPLEAALGAASPAAPPATGVTPSSEDSQRSVDGVRLAFWLCGFHDALMERRRHGEQLTDSEELLIRMSRKDFAGMRPFVIGMTLDRLNALVNAPELMVEAEISGAGGPGAMEIFALASLRSLSQRACQLLQEKGADAALSFFGANASVQEPLAIFQQVFTTALDLLEAFERIIPTEAKLLARLAEALDSEVEKI